MKELSVVCAFKNVDWKVYITVGSFAAHELGEWHRHELEDVLKGREVLPECSGGCESSFILFGRLVDGK